jgi:hypothetical protein
VLIELITFPTGSEELVLTLPGGNGLKPKYERYCAKIIFSKAPHVKVEVK